MNISGYDGEKSPASGYLRQKMVAICARKPAEVEASDPRRGE